MGREYPYPDIHGVAPIVALRELALPYSYRCGEPSADHQGHVHETAKQVPQKVGRIFLDAFRGKHQEQDNKGEGLRYFDRFGAKARIIALQ